jgi:ribosomal protein S18 acetylase RimI-like enzyme
VDAAALRIEPFRPPMQSAFRQLVLDGLAEHWGEVDESLNPDLEDVAFTYRNDVVLVAVEAGQPVATGILVLQPPAGQIVRMSVHQDDKRRGIGAALVSALVQSARDHGVDHLVVETNAAWTEARSFYQQSGFRFTHYAPGTFGSEAFYEMRL